MASSACKRPLPVATSGRYAEPRGKGTARAQAPREASSLPSPGGCELVGKVPALTLRAVTRRTARETCEKAIGRTGGHREPERAPPTASPGSQDVGRSER